MESCLTLSAQSSWLWAAAADLASLLNSAPKGRHHVTPAKTKSWAPLPALVGRMLAQRDRQPLGIPSTRACVSPGGWPAHSWAWAVLGWAGEQLRQPWADRGSWTRWAGCCLTVCAPWAGGRGGEHWILPTARPCLPGWPLAGLPFYGLLCPLQCPLKVQSAPHLGLQNQLEKQSFSLLFGSLGLVLGASLQTASCSDCLQSLWAWPGPIGICDLPVDSSFGTTDLQHVSYPCSPSAHRRCHPAPHPPEKVGAATHPFFGARLVWTLAPCLELIRHGLLSLQHRNGSSLPFLQAQPISPSVSDHSPHPSPPGLCSVVRTGSVQEMDSGSGCMRPGRTGPR